MQVPEAAAHEGDPREPGDDSSKSQRGAFRKYGQATAEVRPRSVLHLRALALTAT